MILSICDITLSIHAYFDIDLDIVWDTIMSDLPPLVAELEKIISPEKNN
jgi:uncharacterized protein with HEPN domain